MSFYYIDLSDFDDKNDLINEIIDEINIMSDNGTISDITFNVLINNIFSLNDIKNLLDRHIYMWKMNNTNLNYNINITLFNHSN
jgi:hypothetical protein